MSYVDAGYASALGALFAYASLLVLRYRRLSSIARSVEDDSRTAVGTVRPELDREEV